MQQTICSELRLAIHFSVVANQIYVQFFLNLLSISLMLSIFKETIAHTFIVGSRGVDS